MKSLDPNTSEGRAEHGRIKAERSPFERLQLILNGAGLNLSMRADNKGKMLVEREGCEPYGIQELSDGERAAFLLSASVITAKPDSLVLIDEPERHLHRSISSPLISSLLQDRPDCTFVISTHDVGLSMDHQPSQCVLLRQFQHTPQQWDFDCTNNAESIDEGIAEAVLGARRTVLFVEGTRTSLDHNLYGRLYPDVSVRACNGCSEVIRTTRGLNRTIQDHWVRAIGVIDCDRRSPEERAKLEADSIICLPVHDVESIYYHPEVIKLVVERLHAAGTITATDIPSQIAPAMINEFEERRDFLTREATVRKLRTLVLSKLPTVNDFGNGIFEAKPLTNDDLSAALAEEHQKFDRLVQEKNVLGMCAAYPLKKTGLRKKVASLLGLRSGQNYENIVRTMVTDDKEAANQVRCLLAPLTRKLHKSVSACQKPLDSGINP